MGSMYAKPKREGPNPYSRSGVPPPKLIVRKDKDKPGHRIHDPMSLQLHMADERIRTAGLSPAEREWRQKFVADQAMHPDEPIHVDAVHRQMNPIRVLYRWPWDKLYKHFLRPSFGPYYGSTIRIMVPKAMWYFFIAECIYYINKYESRGWQKTVGFETHSFKSALNYYSDHDEKTLKLAMPKYESEDYYDGEFANRFILNKYGDQPIDLGPPKRPW